MTEIQVNNLRFHYLREGSGPALLLLHGLGSSSQDWELQIPVFARSYDVIVPDFRGHGQSEKPQKPYSIPHFAEDAAALLQALGVAQAHVIGISMGGMAAYQLAVNFPALIDKLVIVNALPHMVPHNMKERWMKIQRLTLARLFPVEKTARFLAGRLFPKPGQQALADEFVRRFSKNDRLVYYHVLQGMFGWQVISQLPNISNPVLLVAGERDYFRYSEQQHYAEMLPHAFLARILDSGHATPIDQPDVFNELVLRFLDSPPETFQV